ncbi:MAG TPA: CBS domain-containing protein [Chloroflexota bacterium]|nr:CBS domain-containing protein [Chloroflexota bacterium]
MAFLSQIVGKSVYDSRQHKVGLIEDVCVPAHQEPYPQVSAVKVGERWVPWSQIETLEGEPKLRVSSSEIRDYALKPQDVRLRQEVLDHQVVDVEDRKVRRVNDLALSPTNGRYSVLGVDISTRALLRRLGLGAVMTKLGLPDNEELIAWEDVDPVRSDAVTGVRLRRSRETISRLHPSDLADIVEDLTVAEGVNLLNNLDEESAADVLEEIEEERQADLLEQMESARAADILEEMAPDEAADALAEMDPEKAQEVMSLMDAEEFQEVAELLGYDERSAGGIMTTDYVAIAQDFTAAQTIDYIRKRCRDIDMIYTVHVVRDLKTEELVGAVSLRDLIMADPVSKLSDIMQDDPMKVNVSDHQNEVAKTIAKYNLMSVPVVNDDNQLQGIVTIDDAIDILLPTAWKKRLPKMF